MNITEAGIADLTDSDGALLARPTEMLSETDARHIRAAARALRQRRFRMIVRCDACFEGGRADGMRGEIARRGIELECRCRFLRYDGETL